MITIYKSKSAGTRTYDYSKVSRDELFDNTMSHIRDVQAGMAFLGNILHEQAKNHDNTKWIEIEWFYDDFKNGFKEGYTSWWEMHQKKERHHFNNKDFIQDDVNLIDILEQIVDGVMAGLARRGEYRQEEISGELLEKAYRNTVTLLLDNVRVKEQES